MHVNEVAHFNVSIQWVFGCNDPESGRPWDPVTIPNIKRIVVTNKPRDPFKMISLAPKMLCQVKLSLGPRVACKISPCGKYLALRRITSKEELFRINLQNSFASNVELC